MGDAPTLAGFVAEFDGSRFRLPLNVRETLELWLARAAASLRVFADLRVVSPYDIPARWQILLSYLFLNKLIERPNFDVVSWRNDLPPLYVVSLRHVFDSKQTSGRQVVITGQGRSRNPEDAYGKAIGELLERQSLTIYRDTELVRGTYDGLCAARQKPLNVERLNHFLPWQQSQNPLLVFHGKSELAWARGMELLSGTRALIPAQYALWNYRLLPGEPVLVNMTSNGAGAFFSYHEAVLSGLYEAVERDAFVMYWLNTIAPPVLDTASFPQGSVAHEILAQCTRYGIEVYFLDTTGDIAIPTCACVLVDRRGNGSRVAVGAAGGFDTEKNLWASYSEALSIANAAAGFSEYQLPPGYEPFSPCVFIGKPERWGYWKNADSAQRIAGFISGATIDAMQSAFYSTARTFVSVAEEYDHALELFRAKGEGYEVYCYRASRPVLTRLGYVAVKITVPKLFPLYLEERLATLDSPRLREFASRHGQGEAQPNPIPHPFI